MDQDRALFDLDLKDIELVFAQGHVRMSIVAQLTSLSVALAGGVVAALSTLATGKDEIPLFLVLFIPIPFFLFAFLILREDLLMVHHDFYLYRVRKRVLENLNRSASDPTFRFLSEIKQAKMGRIKSVSTFLSALRYGPPVLVLLCCLVWFVKKATLMFSLLGYVNAAMLGLNGILLFALFAGISHLGDLHHKNENLVPSERQNDG